MSLQELKKLLKALREAGVTEYKTADLSLTLAEAPADEGRSHAEQLMSDEPELTPEEEAERLLFYSSPGSN